MYTDEGWSPQIRAARFAMVAGPPIHSYGKSPYFNEKPWESNNVFFLSLLVCYVRLPEATVHTRNDHAGKTEELSSPTEMKSPIDMNMSQLVGGTPWALLHISNA